MFQKSWQLIVLRFVLTNDSRWFQNTISLTDGIPDFDKTVITV